MIWFFLFIALALFLFAFAVNRISNHFIRAFFTREEEGEKSDEQSIERMLKKGHTLAAERITKGREYIDSLPSKDVYIKSFDGLRLHGRYFKAENGESNRCAILCHGYKSSGQNDFACIFEFYRSFGLNILLIDNRSHGESEGKYICFGMKERYDIKDWCRFLCEKNPDCKIVISGISMGATIALLAAALPDMPKNLAGITADCGFTSPRDEFIHVLKTSMKIPVFPALNIVEFVIKRKAGFSFSDASTVDAVKKIQVPIIFIHGEADNFVPHKFTVQNYQACASKDKTIISVPKAEHGMSFLVDEEKCRHALADFFGKII